SMSQRTAMAASWAQMSATGVGTEPPWKPMLAATGKCAIRARGNASKTPSAMAGTKSAHGPSTILNDLLGHVLLYPLPWGEGALGSALPCPKRSLNYALGPRQAGRGEQPFSPVP